MSTYYDLFEKPDVLRTGEDQPLYARFISKGTIDRKEFIKRVHLFTGISQSLLEGALASFMDELRDCLADGWTVELGELGYFSPALQTHREVMNKKELHAASVSLRGLNFRLSKEFYNELKAKTTFERSPQSASTPTSPADALPMEQRLRLLSEYLENHPCILRAEYARLTGRSVKQAISDLNRFIEDGVLVKYGAGRSVVYLKKR